MGNLLQVFIHLPNLVLDVFFVFPEHIAAPFQGCLPLQAQFYKIFDLLNGHARIFKTTDKTYPFEIIVGIPAYTVPAPGNAGQQSFVFVIT
jgi:hypothetical protein